ncbi:putative baseplate hub assembly catalyst protein [Rhizobium phage RHph_I1_18]|nr:putative baseplate hub assembly catalyst protein [Rhizobium phage RHph_I1_18]
MYYKLMHRMKTFGYSIHEYEDLIPFEREVLLALKIEDQEKEAERARQ